MEWVSTYAVHSTALCAAVWLLTSVIPKLSLGTREVLWKLALLGPLATTTVVTASGVPSVWGALPMPEVLRTEAVAVENAPTPAVVSTAPSTALGEGAEPVVERRIVRHRSGDLEITAVRERKPAPAVVPAVAAAPAATKPSAWPLVLLGLWGLGATLALGRLLWAALRLRKQLAGRRDVIEDPVLESFLDLCSKAGLPKRPRLTASAHLRSPIALGRREICLPERAVDSLTPEQQRGMLAHEMAHLLRRDPVWSVVAVVVEAVFFFQPLNHLARRKIQEVAEFQCDDWAAQQNGTGVHLAKCLAEVAGWVEEGPPMSPAVVSMAERGSPIVRRITRLLHERRSGGRVHPAGRVALTVGTLGLVVATVPAVSQAQAPAAAAPAPATAVLARAEASPCAVIFEDHSDGAHDRSRLRLHAGDEVVEIEVQAPRPAPPAPPPEPRDERVEIMIHGPLGYPWLGGWLGGWCCGDVLGLGGFEVFAMPDPLAWIEPMHHHADRARARAERAHERAERHRERALERVERALERQERALEETGWPTLFGVSWDGEGAATEASRRAVVEL
ncbi:MAG: M56 family metallopeptidase [Myxococcales bacterium]|nr:M56 family metallopeptidase [Myxococcales bacterium]